MDQQRSGQSLMEVLLGMAIGGILIIGAVTIIAPSLKVNTQSGSIQIQAQLGQELLNNARAWASSNWNNVLALATGTANNYYLSTASSPFTAAQSNFTSSNWTNGYGYRRTITINAGQVAGTAQTNFPMLFQGTYSTLATVAHGGHVQNANGYDIIFTSDASGTIPLNYQRESYSSSTGQISYWVNIPSLSASTNTIIYLFYGNASTTSDQSNATATWNSNYMGVWHLDETLNCSTCNGSASTTTTVHDSTANVNNLGVYTSGGPWTTSQTLTGVFTNALQIIPSTYEALEETSINSDLLLSSGLTLQIWIDRQETTTEENDLIGTYPNYDYDLQLINNQMEFYSKGNSELVSTTTIPDNSWDSLAFSVNGLVGSFYLNGNFISSSTLGSSILTSDTQFWLGCNYGNDQCMNGDIDEARVSNVARSSNWIKTEYNNESAPSSFYSVGFEVPYGASNLPGELITINGTTYERYFNVNDVYRTPASPSMPTSTASGNYYDPSTKQITVYVGIASSTLPLLSYNFYVTRNTSNVFNQSTWAGGGGYTTVATIVTSTYSNSSNILVTGSGAVELYSGGGSCLY